MHRLRSSGSKPKPIGAPCTDDDAVLDTVVEIDGSEIAPQVSWGTSPEMVVDITQSVPTPVQAADEAQEEGWLRALLIWV